MSLALKRYQGLPATPKFCPDCKSEHIGEVPCGMSWLERVRSTQVDGQVNDSRTKKKYWDQEAVSASFGEDARDKVMEDTQGRGYDGVSMDELFPEALD